jgi:hypothetical protein
MSTEIDEYLAGLSNEQLMAAFKQAEADLAAVAADEPNSEWHQACFAGVLIYAQEMNKRGLRNAALH